MTVKPVSIGPDELAVETVSVLEEGRRRNCWWWMPPAGWFGALHMHDLLRAKLVFRNFSYGPTDDSPPHRCRAHARRCAGSFVTWTAC